MSTTTSARRLRALGIFVTAAVISSGVVLASPGAASESFSESALIRGSSVVSPGLTGTRWELGCPTMPPNQGEDGWVFTLPEGFPVPGTTSTVTGSSAAAYDLDLYFYGADCTFLDSAATVAADESMATPDATKYVLVHAFSGSNNTATLTVASGGGATPTPTITPTPTSSPTAGPAPVCNTYPAAPSDPLFPRQNAIFGGQWGMRKISVPQAWGVPATGCGISVAVLDTGLDLDHEDFACPGKVRVIADGDWIGDGNGPEDGEGHGTHVAGIVGACTNNAKGVVGAAPDAEIMPVQVLDANGEGIITETLPGAITAATDAGAHVINMSLGTLPLNSPIEVLFDEVFTEVEAAIQYAVSRGVVVVAAAGNEGFPMCGYPAIAEDILCVGSSDPRDVKSWFSNFPVKDDNGLVGGPAVLAPGGTGQIFCDFHAEDIVSTYLVANDACDEGYLGYRALNGTSMAAPHVAGVAALVYQHVGARSAANGHAVVDAITSSAADLYAPGYDPASGDGRVDALAAVQAVSGGPSPSPTPTPQVTNTNVQFTESVPVSGQFTDSVSLSARLTDASGTPLAGEELTFQLVGANGFSEASAKTSAEGVAAVDLVIDSPPGDYEVVAAYAGKTATYNGDTERRPFTVALEDSRSTLRVEGAGNRTLVGTLSDGDDATHPIVHGVVSFYANGKYLGEGFTNEDGTVVFEVPASARKRNTSYTMKFVGSEFFRASEATT